MSAARVIDGTLTYTKDVSAYEPGFSATINRQRATDSDGLFS